MDNSQSNNTSKSWFIIVGVIVAVIAIVVYFLITKESPKKHVEVPVIEEVTQPELLPEPVIDEKPLDIEENIVEEPVEVVPEESLLPSIEQSDDWLKERLPSLTWRKELLKLVIDDDMIRRFVVFTDNFSQGIVAYEHSPLIKPTASFSAREINEDGNVIIKWDQTSSRRFGLYVDLLRSVDSEMLVEWYIELKPLVDEAYRELGYPEENFTDILQDAIAKVLDMEFPKDRIELVRPSVMYQYKDADIENLDDADKLMLRLGKENLLIIKSILLEINEKLSRARD